MSPHHRATLVGVIRLIPDEDTIGIPVLGLPGANSFLIPEMDEDLRITRFLDFYNEEGYRLDYSLPDGFGTRVYAVGEPAPIPFWKRKVCHVIEGDAEHSDLKARFGVEATRDPVLLDLGTLLDDARSGRLRERRKGWVATEIANGFGDVFYEPPVHSRYWVSRYKLAVTRARELTKPPHPIDVKLRRVATEWFRRFGTKTDLARLTAMLGDPSSDAIYSPERARQIVFAFVVHQVMNGSGRAIEKTTQNAYIPSLFPDGLYPYFHRRGWPKVPFRYDNPNDLLDLMIDELRGARLSRDYSRPAKLAFLLFGRQRIPYQVENVAWPIMNEESDVFQHMKNSADSIFDDRSEADLWRSTAERLVKQSERLMDLDGIINGEMRLMRLSIDGRYGVSKYYLEGLQKYLGR